MEDSMPQEGGIFDIDGVVLDTPHERAWREALDQLFGGPWRKLRLPTGTAPSLTTRVYQDHVAGKPRLDGARDALAYFGVPDPDGRRARQYAAVKQRRLLELAAGGEFHAYDDAVGLLLSVKAAGIRLCAASSSRNANQFLRQVSVAAYCARHGLHYPFVTPEATLLELFDADVPGWRIVPGKPDPKIFLTAARKLRCPPRQCFVVEDAPAGVEAAKAAGMLAIGVARHQDADLLRAARADLIVTSLDAVDVGALRRGDVGALQRSVPRR